MNSEKRNQGNPDDTAPCELNPHVVDHILHGVFWATHGNEFSDLFVSSSDSSVSCSNTFCGLTAPAFHTSKDGPGILRSRLSSLEWACTFLNGDPRMDGNAAVYS